MSKMDDVMVYLAPNCTCIIIYLISNVFRSHVLSIKHKEPPLLKTTKTTGWVGGSKNGARHPSRFKAEAEVDKVLEPSSLGGRFGWWRFDTPQKKHRWSGWWFQIFFIFTPILGEDSHFDDHIFQRDWNHQPVIHFCFFLGGVGRCG